ncbi:MFS transporter [Actinotalea sp. M2MS4P-6]|uniref:MFS transporter n=1 Tax=Actinotalea sp. M2MS4P-6 TaxID=2983762 RepID=UPI0021E3F639|nr:MFS transporter [Actinotalea sp. M2MS4P-6]MCV2395468.1 MFS transporter [Actinotalea sp. M2MS4P-6]
MSSLSTPARAEVRRAAPWLVMAAILTTQLMLVLDATIVNVALPEIQAALGFSPTALSWVINAYTLTFGGLLLLGARTGDLLGRRRVLLAGIAVFVLASLVGGLAQDSAQLLAARAVQGIGAAFAAPSVLALLVGRFPEGRERARALGWFSAVSIGGSAVGLLAGGALTQWVSWRWVFFVNVPIGLALIAISRFALEETPRTRGRFDLAGALTSTLGVSALVYGFVRAASDGWTDLGTETAFTVGIALISLFVAVEMRTASPITPLALFDHRTRAAALVGRVLLVAGMMGMFFYLTQFLQEVLGYSPLDAGLAFLPLTAVLFAMSRVSAALMTRVGMRPLIIGGLLLSTTALLVLSRLSADSGYLAVLVPLLLFGTGNGLAFVPLTNAALVDVEPAQAGAASGLVNVAQQVGGSLGLAILVTVGSSAAAGASQVGASAAEIAQHAFVVGADRAFFAGAVFIAATVLLLAFTLPRTRARVGSEPAPAAVGSEAAPAAVPAMD